MKARTFRPPGGRAAAAVFVLVLMLLLPTLHVISLRLWNRELPRDAWAYADDLAAHAITDDLAAATARHHDVRFALDDRGVGAYAIIASTGALIRASDRIGASLVTSAAVPTPSIDHADPTVQRVQLGAAAQSWLGSVRAVDAACSPTRFSLDGDPAASPNPAMRALPMAFYYWACVYLDPVETQPGGWIEWGRPLVTGTPLAALAALVPLVAAGRRERRLSLIRHEAAIRTRSGIPELLPDPGSPDLSLVTDTINDTILALQSSLVAQQRFVADAAHELRSPLATMIATLEVAQAYPHITDNDQLTATVLGQAQRLERLVADLLLLARLDARAPVRRDDVDLAVLADEVAATARPRSPVPVIVVSRGRALVVGDEEQLRRALTNLVDNAVRHAISRVDITVENVADDIRLQVANDGPTIPSEDAGRVFERFARLDGARDRDAGGTGLGLAIAREVIRSHGGDLTLAGSSGQETVFAITLPHTSGPDV